MKTLNRIIDTTFLLLEIGLCLTLAVWMTIQSFTVSLIMIIPAVASLFAAIVLVLKFKSNLNQ